MIDRTSASFERSAEIGPAWIWTSSRYALGEERADRPVDQPRRQDFLGRRPPLALDEAAGELAGGVDLLAVVDRQREEVEALAAGAGHDGDERHGVADPDDHGAAGLLGEVAGLDAQDLAADISLDLACVESECWTWNVPVEWVPISHPLDENVWVDWLAGGRAESERDGSRPPYAGLRCPRAGASPRRPGGDDRRLDVGRLAVVRRRSRRSGPGEWVTVRWNPAPVRPLRRMARQGGGGVGSAERDARGPRPMDPGRALTVTCGCPAG